MRYKAHLPSCLPPILRRSASSLATVAPCPPILPLQPKLYYKTRRRQIETRAI
jgi:hypothetical protein